MELLSTADDIQLNDEGQLVRTYHLTEEPRSLNQYLGTYRVVATGPVEVDLGWMRRTFSGVTMMRLSPGSKTTVRAVSGTATIEVIELQDGAAVADTIAAEALYRRLEAAVNAAQQAPEPEPPDERKRWWK